MWSFGKNYWSVDNNFPNLTFKYGEQVISEQASEPTERYDRQTDRQIDLNNAQFQFLCHCKQQQQQQQEKKNKTKITQVSQL